MVNTSSAAHRRATVDFDDLQSARDYAGFKVYSLSKLLNILYTRELARRSAGTGITANSLHPGFVATRFGDASGGLFSYVVRASKKMFAISVEKGAETMVYLASSPEVATISGGYFYQCQLATPTRAAQDDAAARRLWAGDGAAGRAARLTLTRAWPEPPRAASRGTASRRARPDPRRASPARAARAGAPASPGPG